MHVMHAAIKFLRLWNFRLQTQKSNKALSKYHGPNLGKYAERQNQFCFTANN